MKTYISKLKLIIPYTQGRVKGGQRGQLPPGALVFKSKGVPLSALKMLHVPSGPVEKILPRGAEMFDTALLIPIRHSVFCKNLAMKNTCKSTEMNKCWVAKIHRLFQKSPGFVINTKI
jgi:hypothetical protein